MTDFKREVECVYKDEHYSVRDNGAVLRHACKGKRLPFLFCKKILWNG
jgi:hypothetical protein